MTLVKFSNRHPGLFDRFFENERFGWSNGNYSQTNATLPSVNIRENTEEHEVEVAAPGFEKGDFKIELNDGVLSISTEKKVENETKSDEHITREFNYQSFSRSFTLPDAVENEKISAKYENGILSVVIPKKEEAKPNPIKQIAIS